MMSRISSDFKHPYEIEKLTMNVTDDVYWVINFQKVSLTTEDVGG
jgi:hypothetical protein